MVIESLGHGEIGRVGLFRTEHICELRPNLETIGKDGGRACCVGGLCVGRAAVVGHGGSIDVLPWFVTHLDLPLHRGLGIAGTRRLKFSHLTDLDRLILYGEEHLGPEEHCEGDGVGRARAL